MKQVWRQSFDFHIFTMSQINTRELITFADANLVAEKYFNSQDFKVLSYSIVPYSLEKIGFLSSHKRLNICVQNPNEGTTINASFFVKAIPYDVPSHAENVQNRGVFHHETNFFKYIVPELNKNYTGEPWGPQCYLVKHDVLVFEDLGQAGFKMKAKIFDENLIKSGLRALANMHAASMIAEERLGKSLIEIWPDAFKERTFLTWGNQYKWFRCGVDVTVNIADEMNLNGASIPTACNKVFRAMQPSTNKRNVVSHGDLWSNNLLFDDKTQPNCRLVDFQLVRYCPLAHDVAQFLYLCASRQLRDSKGKKLLRYYYEELVKCLKINFKIAVAQPSWQELLDSWEEQKLAAAVSAAMFFQTTMLDELASAEIVNNSKKYDEFMFVNRRDIVVGNMKGDEAYGDRLREIVRELVEMSMEVDNYPDPS